MGGAGDQMVTGVAGGGHNRGGGRRRPRPRRTRARGGLGEVQEDQKLTTKKMEGSAKPEAVGSKRIEHGKVVAGVEGDERLTAIPAVPATVTHGEGRRLRGGACGSLQFDRRGPERRRFTTATVTAARPCARRNRERERK